MMGILRNNKKETDGKLIIGQRINSFVKVKDVRDGVLYTDFHDSFLNSLDISENKELSILRKIKKFINYDSIKIDGSVSFHFCSHIGTDCKNICFDVDNAFVLVLDNKTTSKLLNLQINSKSFYINKLHPKYITRLINFKVNTDLMIVEHHDCRNLLLGGGSEINTKALVLDYGQKPENIDKFMKKLNNDGKVHLPFLEHFIIKNVDVLMFHNSKSFGTCLYNTEKIQPHFPNLNCTSSPEIVGGSWMKQELMWDAMLISEFQNVRNWEKI